jgi:hypothetical protein
VLSCKALLAVCRLAQQVSLWTIVIMGINSAGNTALI